MTLGAQVDRAQASSIIDRSELALLREAFGCDDSLALTIAGLGRVDSYSRGQRLFPVSEAELTTLLLSGHAVEIAYGRDGSTVVLCNIAPGELFGSLLAAGSDEAGAIVEAGTEARGRQFAATTIMRLMESYNCVALAMTRQLAARLGLMRRRMVENMLLSASGRICAELDRRARALPDQTIRPVPVFSELATVVQSTRETVSRTISLLEKRGVLMRADGGLKVVAPHRLAEMIL